MVGDSDSPPGDPILWDDLGPIIEEFCRGIRVLTGNSRIRDPVMQALNSEARKVMLYLDVYSDRLIEALKLSELKFADEATSLILEIRNRINAAYVRTQNGDNPLPFGYLISPRIAQNEVDVAAAEECCLKLETLGAKLRMGEPLPEIRPHFADVDLEPQETPDEDIQVFRADGDRWEVQFRGTGFSLDNLIGCKYIQILLENPRIIYYAHQLRSIESGEEIRVSQVKNDLILDDKATRQYRSQLKRLAGDTARLEKSGRTERDRERLQELTAEREAIKKHIRTSTKHTGKSRPLIADENKHRLAVYSALQTAYKKIGKHSNALESYLRANIATGATLCFTPPDGRTWECA